MTNKSTYLKKIISNHMSKHIILLTLLFMDSEYLYSAATITPEAKLNSLELGKKLLEEMINLTKLSIINPIKKEEIEKLISSGADVKVADRDGFTALMYVAMMGDKDIAKKLIDAGSEIEASGTNNGLTALMLAARNGNKGVLQLLLNANANTNKRDFRRLSAIDHARVNLYEETEEAKKNKADIVKILEIEPQKRNDAELRRKKIREYLADSPYLPPVLTTVIDSYLPTETLDIFADWQEAKESQLKRN